MSAPKKHHLKCLPKYFQLAWDKKKPTEIRNDDRHFAKGDIITLHEWDPDHPEIKGTPPNLKVTFVSGRYTGRLISCNVLEVFRRLPGLADGYAFLVLEQVLFQSNSIFTDLETYAPPQAGLPNGDVQ